MNFFLYRCPYKQTIRTSFSSIVFDRKTIDRKTHNSANAVYFGMTNQVNCNNQKLTLPLPLSAPLRLSLRGPPLGEHLAWKQTLAIYRGLVSLARSGIIS